MSALASTHKGWENEHLATFLLSRLSFVASPVKVCDDQGTDLYCTLFDRVKGKRGGVLVPLNSIAVQVKSSPSPIDVTGKLNYLGRLEIPYYIAVVDQAAVGIDVYSGRYLPHMLSFRGRLRLELVPVDSLGKEYRTGDDETGYRLHCPWVVSLNAKDSMDDVANAMHLISVDAARSQAAINSRMNGEFIFQGPSGLEIFTGRDSAKHFRENFYMRLAEAYHNLSWLLENRRSVASGEIQRYLDVYDSFFGDGTPVPVYLVQARERLLKAVGGPA